MPFNGVEIDIPELDGLSWQWLAPTWWFGVASGLLLTLWLISRPGRRFDRLAGALVGLSAIFVNPVLASLIVGLAVAIHSRRLQIRFRIGIGVVATAGALTAGHGMARWAETNSVPIINLVILTAIICSGLGLRLLRIRALDRRRNFTSSQRDEIIKRDGNVCSYCGANGETRGVTLEMDHIIPWSLGGKTKINNAQLLCGPCNRSKGNKSDREARSRYQQRTGEEAGSFNIR